MHTKTVIITLTACLWAVPVNAQQYYTAVPVPCPAPSEPCTLEVCEVTAPCPAPPMMAPTALRPPMDIGGLHRYLLQTNDDYRSARRSRTAGILISSIGGSLGMVVALAGALTCNAETCSDEDKAVAYTGLGIGVASLAIGIPVAVSGQRRMRAIRTAYLPAMGFAVGPRGGRLQAAWRF